MSENDKIHPWQKVLDNPWLLLALGILVPIISYTVWGWLDLAFLSEATLP